MISLDMLKKWALELPDTEEKMHFEKPSYRVKGRIFSTYHPKDHKAMVILSEIDQSVFCSIPGENFYPVAGTWGKQGCTMVNLSTVDKDVLRDALKCSYDFILAKNTAKKKPSKQKKE